MIAATLADVSKWLAATSLSNTIQTVGWIIPTLQTIHILAVAVLFSSAVLVDMRIWRITQRDVAVVDVAHRFLLPIFPLVLILAITGCLLIVGEPRRSLLNDTFYVKMALLVAALVVSACLQWVLLSSPDGWEKSRARRLAGRLAAVLSLLLWSGVIFAGRFIAYTQV